MNNQPQQHENMEEEEQRLPHKGSYLFERYAIWAILVFLGVSIWYKVVPLILVGTFLIVTTLLITFWKKKALSQVYPTLRLSHTKVFAQSNIVLQAGVANAKWLPLVWLEWEQIKQPGIIWDDKKKEHYQIRFLWLLWYQKISWEIKAKALQRGVFEMGNIILRSGDAFRFTEDESKHELGISLYVYPQLLPVAIPALPTSLQWGLKGKSGGFLEDPLLVNGLREYQSGDEWRRIHWRASARTGVLQTSIYETIVARKLQIFIDVHGFSDADVEKREQFEWFLSVIASVALGYHEKGVWVGFATNALDYQGRRMERIHPTQGLTPFLDQLAKITANLGEEAASISHALRDTNSIPTYIFCYTISDEHQRFWQKNLRQAPFLTFYHLQDSAHSRLMRGSAKKMESLLSTSGLKGSGS